ncbi:amino acid ABC transporter ATP-binding protein [Candidatus Finniella inopinata]|uniref:Amino acid ABC transporter ATP-binding protein n=1 Tax=Candidatus Finniella inopinata TaxID=1696036 RepID=A0A4Q7DGN0_9PROT|nr:amino acid ABC transporter ATP-binding protein [Candidatus Finniella inopinata]RZI45358.1 amino acid ABC transporter ATP-binding protein [Candidatus Finniella inopinata]
MLKCCNLIKTSGELTVLNNLSFSSKLGKITAVIGPSGSGKTTLLRCLAQLDKPDSGSVDFAGRDLSHLAAGEIGFVFQAFHLFPHITVLENLTLAPLSQGFDRAGVEQQAYALLQQFGLQTKDKAYPVNLSGGQKQRVAIARALMKDPAIMLFDEPTSALDPEMVKDVGDIILSVRNPKRVIVLVTHEMRLAQAVADHILFLDHGVILDDLPASQFFAKDGGDLLSKRAQKFLSNLT